MNPHYRSFDQISSEDRKITVGKFSKIVYNLGFNTIPQRKLIEIFKKVCKGRHLMNLNEFVPGLESSFIALRDVREERFMIEFKRLKRKEREMASGKNAGQFIMELIAIRTQQIAKKKAAALLRKYNDSKCLDIGYNEIDMDKF